MCEIAKNDQPVEGAAPRQSAPQGDMDITARMDRMPTFGPKKSEAEEIAELNALGINHPARRRHREQEQRAKLRQKEKAWNGSVMRSRPSNLRGMKVVTKEPWARDEAAYQKRTGSFEEEVNADEPYDDRSVLSASKGYQSTITAGLGGRKQPAWDSSPLRAVPHTLKGLKPITREPWSVDQEINRDMSLEGFDTFGAKLENDSAAGNFFNFKST